MRYLEPKLAEIGCRLIQHRVWTTPESEARVQKAIEKSWRTEGNPLLVANANQEQISEEELQQREAKAFQKRQEYRQKMADRYRYLQRVEQLQKLKQNQES